MPGSGLGTEDAAVNKIGKIPAPWNLQCRDESLFFSGLSLYLRKHSLGSCSPEADSSLESRRPSGSSAIHLPPQGQGLQPLAV